MRNWVLDSRAARQTPLGVESQPWHSKSKDNPGDIALLVLLLWLGSHGMHPDIREEFL